MTKDNEKTLASAQGPTQLPATEDRDKRRDVAIWIFIFIPILSLALNAVSWLRFGLDIPFWDDWRGYISGGIGTFSLKYLFTPCNDTLYPVGLALDSVAQHLLDGNGIAWQFISMITVLGLLLLLQWRLLSVSLRDRLLAASAFSLTLLMLQPRTYWGLQNIAYQQGLPVLFNLAAVYIVAGRAWSDRWSIPSLFALGILSGLSYISGAPSVAAIGAILFILAHFIRPCERKPLRAGGLTLFAAGLITLIAQIWALAVYRSGAPNRPPVAFPYQGDFWMFLLGKIGRSILLPHKYPGFSLPVTILVVLAVCILAGLIVRRFARGEMRTLQDARTSVVTLATLGGTFAYLLVLAAGRTNVHPPDVKTATEIFSLGFSHIHYFWVTLLWPWMAAALFETFSKINPSERTGSRLRLLALRLPAVLLPLFIVGGALKHVSCYRHASYLRADGIACFTSQIQKGNTVDCPSLFPPGHGRDLVRAFVYAKSIGASFTRSIPLLPAQIGTAEPAPLFRLSNANTGDLDIRGTAAVEKTETGYRFHKAGNPQILFKPGAPEIMGQCLALEVSALMRVAEPETTAQISYGIPGREGLTGKASQEVPFQAGENKLVEVSFQLFSPTGFRDELRLEPVSKPQEFDLADIEVRCRISKN